MTQLIFKAYKQTNKILPVIFLSKYKKGHVTSFKNTKKSSEKKHAKDINIFLEEEKEERR